MANGEPFDMNKTYQVAVNSYRGNGGGDLLTKGAGIQCWRCERCTVRAVQ